MLLLFMTSYAPRNYVSYLGLSLQNKGICEFAESASQNVKML